VQTDLGLSQNISRIRPQAESSGRVTVPKGFSTILLPKNIYSNKTHGSSPWVFLLSVLLSLSATLQPNAKIRRRAASECRRIKTSRTPTKLFLRKRFLRIAVKS